jgi:transcriptional regulator with XRE-family HTH domain
MAKTLTEIISKLPVERQEKIEARAKELISEEMTLREVRKAHNLTQEHLAELLGVGQDSILRLEQRSDLLLSTLRNYIKAMGGNLQLIAEFPDRPPVVLTGFADLENKEDEL